METIIGYQRMTLKFMKKHLKKLKHIMLEVLTPRANMEKLFQNKKH